MGPRPGSEREYFVENFFEFMNHYDLRLAYTNKKWLTPEMAREYMHSPFNCNVLILDLAGAILTVEDLVTLFTYYPNFLCENNLEFIRRRLSISAADWDYFRTKVHNKIKQY